MKKSMMMAALLGFVATQAVQAAVIAINFQGGQTGSGAYGIDPTATAFGVAAGDWVSGQRTTYASGTTTFSDSVAAADLPAGVTASWGATGDWLITADGTGAAPGEEEIAYGFLGDGGSGADLTFTGLGAWLAAEGASSYKIEYIYASNYNTNPAGLLNLTFADAPVYTSDGGSLLGTIDGGTQGDYTFYKGNTAVYYASSISGLTSDTLFIDGQARDGAVRGVLGGVVITSIPEPATLGLVAAFGGGVLFIRRRFML